MPIKTKMILKKINSENFLLLIYKLSYDLLLLLILSFAATLFLEAILPGIVSTNHGFTVISFLLFATIFISATIGKKLNIKFKINRKHHFLPLILTGSFILIGNSLLKFHLWENIVITTLTIFIFSILYRNIFSSKE